MFVFIYLFIYLFIRGGGGTIHPALLNGRHIHESEGGGWGSGGGGVYLCSPRGWRGLGA